ncbi:hypothetical protein [Flavobacterium sp.]|uniref:hypothetical protein n=1 Tax=Flavobacterium sp. TaxID=239 RepID=UPI00374FF337
MRKKLVVSGIILVVFLFAFIYFKYIFGWQELRSNNYTSKEYKSLINISKEQYFKDSLTLVSIIRKNINNHEEPYTAAIRVNEKLEFINDSFTKIYIDSIFYSPNVNRIAFLVIVENDNKKQYKGMTRKEADGWEKEGNLPYEGTFFDGNCFVAERINNNLKSSFYGYSFTNSRSYKENSDALRNACLNQLEEKNTKKQTYNIDDIRFWNSTFWNTEK